MTILTLDFETVFDKDFSLRKIPTSMYVKDPRFKVLTCAFKRDILPAHVCVGDEEIREYLAGIRWNETAVLAHHTQFDGLILAHHYGIVPSYYLNTMSMARAKYGCRSRVGLDDITNYLGLANKSDNVDFAKGLTVLEGDNLKRMIEYNLNDVEITYALYNKLLPFPTEELDLIDLTIRMFTQPGFNIDVPRAQAEYEKEVGEKVAQMLLAGLTKETLGSSEKFANWLLNQGVNIPYKFSEKQQKAVYAFAKTDVEFTALLGHDNELVRLGVAARLGNKSTGNESRAKRFVDEGSLGPLPVYLSYYGAHTGRWSGGNKINLQNLKRGGELRKCLIAPAGYVIGVADSGQIECRVNAWLSGQTDLLDRFRLYDSGDKSNDPYRVMASLAYGIGVGEVNSTQRFIGKIAVLGLGFQMGAEKYRNTLASGAMGPKVEVTDNESWQVVQKYRSLNTEIVDMWARCELILDELERNVVGKYKCIQWRNDRVYLPNGMYLDYPGLTFETDPRTGRVHKHFKVQDQIKGIYGGLMLENIVQALARIIVSTQMLEISQRYKVLTMTHDEIVCLIPEDEAQEGWDFMFKCMTTAPDWCADLPLMAEGGFAKEYSK